MTLAPRAHTGRAAWPREPGTFRALMRGFTVAHFEDAVRTLAAMTRGGVQRADCEDAIQEAVARLYARADETRIVPNLQRLILHAARNVIRDVWKSAFRQQRADLLDDMQHGASGDKGFVDPRPDPLRALLHTEARRHLHDAYGALPPRRRLAFVLRHLDGHEPAEIARIMGVTHNAAKMMVCKATRDVRARHARSTWIDDYRAGPLTIQPGTV